jgi:hypothetical protein
MQVRSVRVQTYLGVSDHDDLSLTNLTLRPAPLTSSKRATVTAEKILLWARCLFDRDEAEILRPSNPMGEDHIPLLLLT